LFSQQELRGRVDKTPAQKYQNRQFESSGFHNCRSNHPETSGRHFQDDKGEAEKKKKFENYQRFRNQVPTKNVSAPVHLVPLSRPQKLLAWHVFPAGKIFLPRPSIWAPRIIFHRQWPRAEKITICIVTNFYFKNYWLHTLTAHVT
jgi:hypothetical protein